VGDLGPWARRFVDWLAQAGQCWWQVLPLSPPGPGNSPYAGTSVFAGNTLLISPEDLVEDGLLGQEDLLPHPDASEHSVVYEVAKAYKNDLLRRAHQRFTTGGGSIDLQKGYEEFRRTNASWLSDYCLLAAVHARQGLSWPELPRAVQLREPEALAGLLQEHREEVDHQAFLQFLFYRQWDALRRYAHQRSVRIIGDVPIFVTLDSADVWAHPQMFQLDADRRPLTVSGVPPDYFSKTGQLWGHPLYDWEALSRTGYRWWIDRLRSAFSLLDMVRVDHFRGFEAYWSVPAGALTAAEGSWVKAPGKELFHALREELGDLPLIAEDLGLITEEVHELRKATGLPGMAVLQFAFDGGEGQAYLPHRHDRDLVVYTGTHDNNTTMGWFLEDLGDADRERVRRYLGKSGAEIHWDLLRLACASVADLVVIPFQDLVGLGSDCRMNTPGVESGQWTFRMVPWMLARSTAARLREIVEIYERLPAPRSMRQKEPTSVEASSLDHS
jgi:4-alpha-glucanotransferase